MKFGLCITTDLLPQVNVSEIDFLEYRLAEIAALNGEEYKICRREVEKSGLAVEAFNVFIPSNIALRGDEVDTAKIKEYLKNSIKRADDLGGKTIIFGSSKARYINDEKDKIQIINAARLMAEEAEKYGITIAVEPLNKNETNYINTVTDGYNFASDVNRKNFKTMVDFFHFWVMDETVDDLISAQEMITHVHISGSERDVPNEKDFKQLQIWNDMLKTINYDGRLSIEVSEYKDFKTEKLRFNKIFDIFR